METLSSRERVEKALEHEEPDRVPMDLGGFQSGITVLAYEKLKEKLGIRRPTRLSERNQQLAVVDEEVLQEFGVDMRYVFPRSPSSWDPREIETPHSQAYIDEWGMRWEKPHTSYYYDPVGFPLHNASREALSDYPWLNPEEKSRFSGLKGEAQKCYEAGFAVATTVSGVFEQAWYLVGLERMLIDMVGNPQFIEALLDRVLDILGRLYSGFLDEVGPYLTLFEIWEDVSTQSGPLFSPALYRKMVKPRTRELIATIRKKTPAKIALHSCGSVSWAIDDFLEIGVEVLNPIQVSASHMDTAKLKEKYGDRLSFWGAIDTQRVLPHGSVAEVAEEVKRRIDDLGRGGGYILAAVHNIQPDVPPENILTMFHTARSYGKYPLPQGSR